MEEGREGGSEEGGRAGEGQRRKSPRPFQEKYAWISKQERSTVCFASQRAALQKQKSHSSQGFAEVSSERESGTAHSVIIKTLKCLQRFQEASRKILFYASCFLFSGPCLLCLEHQERSLEKGCGGNREVWRKAGGREEKWPTPPLAK